MKKENILVLSSTFPRWENDTEPNFIYELCSGLKDKFNVTILTSHHKNAKTHEIMDGLNIYRYRYSFSIFETLVYNGGIISNLKKTPLKWLLLPTFISMQFFWILYLSHKYKISVIHAHWLIPQGALALLAQRVMNKSIKILCTSHGSDLFGLNDPISSKLKKWVLKHVDILTVVSKPMLNKAKEISPTTQTKSFIIPMGTDLRNTFFPKKDITRKNNTLLYAGRLVDNKGVDILIKTIPEIKKHFPSILLLIVGDGPQKKPLQVMAETLKVDSSIKFLGSHKHDDLVKFYCEATLAVFPYRGEQGFGLVLVEALGCQCPVITADVASVHDIIENNKTGYIVPINNVHKLSRKIIWSLSNLEKINTTAITGKKFVYKTYDWTITHKRFIELLTSLTKKDC